MTDGTTISSDSSYVLHGTVPCCQGYNQVHTLQLTVSVVRGDVRSVELVTANTRFMLNVVRRRMATIGAFTGSGGSLKVSTRTAMMSTRPAINVSGVNSHSL